MRRRRLPFVSATVDAQCLLHGAGQTELQRPSGLDVPLGPASHRLPIPTPLIIGLGASVGSLESGPWRSGAASGSDTWWGDSRNTGGQWQSAWGAGCRQCWAA